MFRISREDENEESEDKIAQVKEREEIVPRASSTYVKDLAKRPLYARAVLYLYEHGITYQTELYEAIGCTQGTAYWMMRKLGECGIVKILRQMERENPVLDKRMTYYKLSKAVKNTPTFIPELKKWFQYECLKTLERYFSPYQWVKVEELKEDMKFNYIVNRRYGMRFEDALKLLVDSGVFWVERNRDDDVVEIKRMFDNYGRRIDRDVTTPPPTKEQVSEEVKEVKEAVAPIEFELLEEE